MHVHVHYIHVSGGHFHVTMKTMTVHVDDTKTNYMDMYKVLTSNMLQKKNPQHLDRLHHPPIVTGSHRLKSSPTLLLVEDSGWDLSSPSRPTAPHPPWLLLVISLSPLPLPLSLPPHQLSFTPQAHQTQSYTPVASIPPLVLEGVLASSSE